jgi:hypothetical protein
MDADRGLITPDFNRRLQNAVHMRTFLASLDEIMPEFTARSDPHTHIHCAIKRYVMVAIMWKMSNIKK